MLIDFLTDVVTNMDSFKDDVSTIYVYHHQNNLIATANHVNRLIFYQCVPINNLTEHLGAPMYLGALGFLRSLLGSTMMRDEPRVEISYREKDGNKLCAASMKFIAKQIESSFECTNPDILNEKDRVRQFPRPSDAVYFSVDKEMRKRFEEVAKFNTPKADSRLFTLAYDGKYVRAIFGLGKHTTNLILTEDVEGHTGQKFQKFLTLDRFRSMIKLASDNGGKAGYHPMAFWCDFDTIHSIHTIACPTIRDQNR